MKNLVVPPLVTALLLAAGVGAGQQPPVLTPRDSAFHALNRLAYGPRPGDVARLAREGVMRWIDRQLAPDQIADGDRVAREREFRVLHYDRGDLAQLYLDAQRERRERKADTTADQTPGPALLFHLDNWASVALGLNETCARELLELHTRGVDGGYTQQDVINVARIFTGWSIKRPRQGGDCEFHEWAHDEGQKQVLGVRFQAGHGMDEGIRLLKLLANQPATMHHVSHQLCERFVSDDPPDGCVDDAVAAWKRSGGDLREVLRAIFTSPDFWAPRTLGGKVKTPLEFVVSAARVVGADPDTNPRLAQLVARLGEPLYLHVAPDGYPEKQDAWVNSGALLDRMNAAVALAAGNVPGLVVNLDSIVSPTADADRLVAALDERILGGTLSPNTRKVLREQLADVGDPLQARALAVGLAIGGPEFQRQ